VPNKYHVDRRGHRYRRARRRIVALAIIVFIGTLLYLLFNLEITPRQNIENAPSTTRTFDDESAKNVSVSKPEFSIELPAGWKEAKSDASLVPAPKYVFSSKPEDQQTLRIYLDTVPSALGVNKAVTVTARGNQIDHDIVSENCANYTGPAQKNLKISNAPAKWQNIDFLCDLANSARPIVGAISVDGMNFLKVKGQTIGERRIFITYGDFNNNPNYVTLYDILESIRFK
jgi:hypothetical protein